MESAWPGAMPYPQIYGSRSDLVIEDINYHLHNLFKKVAAGQEVTAEEVERDIQCAIDYAWSNASPAARQEQLKLFPYGKPSVEEFMCVILLFAQQVRIASQEPARND